MESIQVGYVAVGGVPYSYHKYLIYTDSKKRGQVLQKHT
jgi:hypothetical protein